MTNKTESSDKPRKCGHNQQFPKRVIRHVADDRSERVTASPNPPLAGKSITISYDPSQGALAGDDRVYINYGYDDAEWTECPGILMSKKDNYWQSTLALPDNISHIIMAFNNGGTLWDNNDHKNWTFHAYKPEAFNLTNDVIKQFREHGNYKSCLEHIQAGEQPQYALQRVLGRVASRQERDLLEDISYVLESPSHNISITVDLAQKILLHAQKEYGNDIKQFTNETEILHFINGLQAELEARAAQPLPTNGLVAAVGHLVADKVGQRVRITQKEYGQSLKLFDRSCSSCGGQGYIYCDQCILTAESDNHPVFHMHNIVKAKDKVKAVPERYGCIHCNNSPITNCTCLCDITVSDNPKDGQLLKGHYVASGKPYYCVLILEEG